MARTTENSIEALIDSSESLEDFLTMVQTVCMDKADHITMNWQDGNLAAAWEGAANSIGRAVQHVAHLGI